MIHSRIVLDERNELGQYENSSENADCKTLYVNDQLPLGYLFKNFYGKITSANMHERLTQQTIATRTSALERRIEQGITTPDGNVETDPRRLTRVCVVYLGYKRDYHRALAQEATTPVSREENSLQAVKAHKTLKGSFQREGLNYCLDRFTSYRNDADILDSEEAKEAAQAEGIQEDYRELVTTNRRSAVGWLRMAAACLEMPGGEALQNQPPTS